LVYFCDFDEFRDNSMFCQLSFSPLTHLLVLGHSWGSCSSTIVLRIDFLQINQILLVFMDVLVSFLDEVINIGFVV
jgi:hypothetical protein